MASKTFVVAVLCALLAFAHAHDFLGPHTLELTASNYEEQTSSGKVFLIAYFAPWCGHCKRLGPTWKDLGAKLASNSNVRIAFVDCTVHRDVCQKNDVKGYPTIKAVHKNKEYKVYRGPREVSNLYDFVIEAAKELSTESS